MKFTPSQENSRQSYIIMYLIIKVSAIVNKYSHFYKNRNTLRHLRTYPLFYSFSYIFLSDFAKVTISFYCFMRSSTVYISIMS